MGISNKCLWDLPKLVGTVCSERGRGSGSSVSLTTSGTTDPETDLHLLLTDRFDSWLVTWRGAERGGGGERGSFVFYFYLWGFGAEVEKGWRVFE